MALSDTELVRLATQRAPGALTELLARSRPVAQAVALEALGDPGEADEVVQEALLAVVEGLADLEDPAAYWGWLRRIARNRAIDRARRRRSEPLDEDLPDVSDDVITHLERGEAHAALRAALDALPEDARALVVLHYWEGWPLGRVAERMDVSEDAVKQRLARARKRLRADVLARLAAVFAGTVTTTDAAIRALADAGSPPGPLAPRPSRLLAGAALAGAGSATLFLLLLLRAGAPLLASPGEATAAVAPAPDAPPPDPQDPHAAARELRDERMAALRSRKEREGPGAMTGDVAGPTWSPDCRRIAFTTRGEGRARVGYATWDGRALGPLQTARDPAAGAPGERESDQPVWHPRNVLVFRSGSAGQHRLWIVDPSRTPTMELLSRSDVDGDLGQPHVTLDHVAFVADGEVAVHHTLSGRTTRFGPGREPRLSADGRSLAFLRGADVVVADLASDVASVVAAARPAPSGPAWTSSGPAWFERAGDAWAIATPGGVLVEGVAAPTGHVAVSRDGGAVLWSDGEAFHLTAAGSGASAPLAVAQRDPREPALCEAGGARWLAYTASTAAGRGLFVAEAPGP